jgi:uncharacterized protein (TIRG00374 family)
VKDFLRAGIGLLLSALVIWLILRGADIAAIRGAILRANLPLLLLAAVVATSIFPLRAIRWKYILEPVDPDIRYGLLWRSTAIGFGLNNALPLRLGEAARAYAVSRGSSRVGFPAAVASLAVDRVFDMIAIIALLAIGMSGIADGSDASTRNEIRAAMVITIGGALALLVVLCALAFFPDRFIALFRGMTARIFPRLADAGASILGSFAQGFSVLRSPRRFALVLGWATIHWLVNALAFWIGFVAVGLDMNSSYLAALATQGVIAIASAIPQGPGFVGGFQASGQLALGSFGVNAVDALAWGFAYWFFSFLPITVIGLVYFTRMGISVKELRGFMSRDRKPKRGAPHTAGPAADDG